LPVCINASENTVYWDIRQICRHGIEKLCFGDVTAGFICEKRLNREEPRRITVTSDGAFILAVKNGNDLIAAFDINPGISEYKC